MLVSLLFQPYKYPYPLVLKQYQSIMILNNKPIKFRDIKTAIKFKAQLLNTYFQSLHIVIFLNYACCCLLSYSLNKMQRTNINNRICVDLQR